MLIRLSPRSLLVVALLVFSPAAAQARGGAVSIGQSNPGTIDIKRTIDPQALVRQIGATTTTGPQALSATGAVLSPLQPTAGANGVPLTATNSGAIPTSIGGTAVLGAAGRDMTECMAAWDTKTHITKSRWREIRESTLVEPTI
jgi:hypothetical protein